jgi:gliding motility-associated-like protein
MQTAIFPGNYWVKVSNACGMSSDTIRITNDCLPVIFIPSAFTPNGDGNNDVFRILNVHGQKLQSFSVFNRLGERIFYTKSVSGGWNGSFRGEQQPPGSYIYIIKITNLAGKLKIYKGTVVLIR